MVSLVITHSHVLPPDITWLHFDNTYGESFGVISLLAGPLGVLSTHGGHQLTVPAWSVVLE